MAQDREELRDSIRSCKPYKRYKRILREIESKFDPETIKTGAKNMHSARLSRTIDPKKMSPKMLIEAHARDIQYRARYVELLVSLESHKTDLNPLVLAVKKYLMSEFPLEGAKYKNEKQAYFDRYFRDADQLVAEVDHLIKMLLWFIEDIDKSSYRMRDLVKLVEMVYSKESRI
jgi:hypothetical protein